MPAAPSLADAEKLKRCVWPEPRAQDLESEIMDGLLFESMNLAEVDKAAAAVSTSWESSGEHTITRLLRLPLAEDDATMNPFLVASEHGFLPLEAFRSKFV